MPDRDVVDPGDKIGVSMSQKVNLGNYESKDFFASVTITVRDGEDVSDAFHRAWSIVEAELEEKLSDATTQPVTDFG